MLVAAIVASSSVAFAQREDWPVRPHAQRRIAAEELAGRMHATRFLTREKAGRLGIPMRSHRSGSDYVLISFEEDRPVYYKTMNRDSAIAAAALDLWTGEIGYIGGLGVRVGIWDDGAVMSDHQEFTGRVEITGNLPVSRHATHVGGTIAAAGIDVMAKGMAWQAELVCHDMAIDSVGMLASGAAYPGEPGRILISNHSYGRVAGWDEVWHSEMKKGLPAWFGRLNETRDQAFGAYGRTGDGYEWSAAKWDSICYELPYYQPFVAAGNDRADSTPQAGQLFYHAGGKYVALYDPNIHPLADGNWLGGYDTVPEGGATAKNSITVGAVQDAVINGARSTNTAITTPWSAWGPTDDGRVKPDLVANGNNVYSPVTGSTDAYDYSEGTSSAAPSATGTAALLVQLYADLFDNDAMRASSLKALMLHTADDLGNPGPDYIYGWGLLNGQAAVDKILLHYYEPLSGSIVEERLNSSEDVHRFTFQRSEYEETKVTICWTDPEGAVLSGLDDRTPRLVNDLDLRVFADGVEYYPWVLNPDQPDLPATTGNNIRDNVEQVILPSGQWETFVVQVSAKHRAGFNGQVYSLIVSGQQHVERQVHISGTVFDYDTNLPVEGVLISGEPYGYSHLTGEDGRYEFVVPRGWAYPDGAMVQAEKHAYVFYPPIIDFNDISLDRWDQDFHARLLMPNISGRLTDSLGVGISGGLITTNPDVGDAISDPNGFYSLPVPYGYSGNVMPVQMSAHFSPAYISYENVYDDIVDQNFAATDIIYRITGRIVDAQGRPLSEVGICRDIDESPCVETDGFGYYTISVTGGYSVELRPIKYGFVFEPAVILHEQVEADIGGADYAAMALVLDTFDDDRRAAAWAMQNDAPAKISLVQSDGALHLLADVPENESVSYAANHWHIDPNEHFSMRINFSLAPSGDGDGWILMGIENSAGEYAGISAGIWDSTGQYQCESFIDGLHFSVALPRSESSGFLYISFDPNSDSLYASFTGYGPEEAMHTWDGLLHGLWNRSHVRVFFGGGGNGIQLEEGDARIGSFEINRGVLSGLPVRSDLDEDGYIDLNDLLVVAQQWLESGPDLVGDINGDGIVNFIDLAFLAAGW